MADLIEYLKRFNRKERFYLIGWSLGNEGFRLSDDFRASVAAEVGLSVPRAALTFMDYHLNWIYASAFLASVPDHGEIHDNSDGTVEGNQEDVDLLIAFQHDGLYQLVMLEAKFSTGWTNKQMKHKAARLGGIFGQNGRRWPGIRPYFLLTSPREPGKLDCKAWPTWMTGPNGRPRWIEMRAPGMLERVTRCDAEGKESAGGRHWRVLPVRLSKTRLEV
ncbi:MAG: hypothetical protein WEE64_15310 [Dehalococcoidia bacterium]